MVLSPVLVWLIAGVILCLVELVLPTAFVQFAMGISAILVALLAQVIPSFGVQVALWLVLSVVLIMLTRQWMPRRVKSTIEDAKEAKTLTSIPPGQVGRVLYEGNSWQARCGDHELAIAANQTVYVIARKGTTLIVMPETLLLE